MALIPAALEMLRAAPWSSEEIRSQVLQGMRKLKPVKPEKEQAFIAFVWACWFASCLAMKTIGNNSLAERIFIYRCKDMQRTAELALDRNREAVAFAFSSAYAADRGRAIAYHGDPVVGQEAAKIAAKASYAALYAADACRMAIFAVESWQQGDYALVVRAAVYTAFAARLTMKESGVDDLDSVLCKVVEMIREMAN